MLPHLRAEESQLAATRTAMGTGSLTKDDARRVQRDWARDTGASRQKAQKLPLSMLPAIGIGFHVVEKPITP